MKRFDINYIYAHKVFNVLVHTTVFPIESVTMMLAVP